jgi:signal transduction histidine kinase
MVPMRVAGHPLGVLMVFNHRGHNGRFSDNDLRLAELFAERAAQAIDLTRRVSRDALIRVVAAQEHERRRLGSELHNDAQQMLAAILMGIRTAARSTSPEDRQAAHEHLAQLTEATIASMGACRTT